MGIRMPLSTPRNARTQFAKYIRQLKLSHTDEFSLDFARVYANLFRTLGGLMKIEMDQEIEQRIEALEEFAAQGGFSRAKHKA